MRFASCACCFASVFSIPVSLTSLVFAPWTEALLTTTTVNGARWTISTSTDPNEVLRVLHLSGSGPVFISYDATLAPALDTAVPDHLLAQVRLSWDDDDEDLDGELTITSGVSGEIQMSGYGSLREGDAEIEIILARPNQLQKLVVTGSGDVVVTDKVFVAAPDDSDGGVGGESAIGINVSGRGSVFVQTSEQLTVTSASFDVSGSGNLQFEAQEFHFESLAVRSTAGAATVKLFTNPQSASSAGTSTFAAVTTGTVCWDTPHFSSTNLKATVTGSGAISAIQPGTCVSEEVNLSGSGDIQLGAVSCQHAQVLITGSGDVVVHATDYLGGTITGSGDVKYVGPEPQVMSDKNGQIGVSYLGYKFKGIARPANSQVPMKCTKATVPTRKLKRADAHDHGDTVMIPNDDAPSHGDADGGQDQNARWTSISSSIDTTAHRFWDTVQHNEYIAIPVAIFVLLWLLVLGLSRCHCFQRRRRDPERRALLGHQEDEDLVYI